MAGSRVGGFEVVYPVNEVAAKHDASVLEETSRPDEAYARWGPEARSAYREGWLPAGTAATEDVSGTSDARTHQAERC